MKKWMRRRRRRRREVVKALSFRFDVVVESSSKSKAATRVRVFLGWVPGIVSAADDLVLVLVMEVMLGWEVEERLD